MQWREELDKRENRLRKIRRRKKSDKKQFHIKTPLNFCSL